VEPSVEELNAFQDEAFYMGQAVLLCGEVGSGSKLAAWCFLPTYVLPNLDSAVRLFGVHYDARPASDGDSDRVELFIYKHSCALELRKLLKSIDGEKDIQLKLSLFSLIQGYSYDTIQRLYDNKALTPPFLKGL
jgi:hypothetical protein